MAEDGDYRYFMSRAETCRGLALRAASPAIARLHQEFAARYEMRAREMSPPLRMQVPLRA